MKKGLRLLGMDGKLYRNTGTYPAPVLTIIDNCKDVDLKIERDEADVTTRGNNGFKATVATLRTAEITFNAIWQPGTALNTLLLQSVMNSKNVEFWALDGVWNVAGTSGLRAVCQLFGFSRSEKLTEAMEIPVVGKPTISSTPPVWYECVATKPPASSDYDRFVVYALDDQKFYKTVSPFTAWVEVS